MSEPGGKGSARRPRQISEAEEALRWKLLQAPASEKPALERQLEEMIKEGSDE